MNFEFYLPEGKTVPSELCVKRGNIIIKYCYAILYPFIIFEVNGASSSEELKEAVMDLTYELCTQSSDWRVVFEGAEFDFESGFNYIKEVDSVFSSVCKVTLQRP